MCVVNLLSWQSSAAAIGMGWSASLKRSAALQCRLQSAHKGSAYNKVET